MREHALETHEPSCTPRAAKAFFIPVAYDPLRAVGHVAILEPLPWEAEPRDVSYVAAPKATFIGKQGLELRDIWHLVVAQLATCLIFNLYTGVSGLKGTDNAAC
jgi:hypothetical protein